MSDLHAAMVIAAQHERLATDVADPTRRHRRHVAALRRSRRRRRRS
ncbi:MAG: hypothetical protein R8G01_09460 [Ilumatobacteraceae bacterium]|nr:hypothetical protein [Ilumatobacteraceae bacterium]